MTRFLCLTILLSPATGGLTFTRDSAAPGTWTESFDDETAFDQHWGACGWHPDGKTSSKKEDRPLWWVIKDGTLQANTSRGVRSQHGERGRPRYFDDVRFGPILP
jgi:hypothetical protein